MGRGLRAAAAAAAAAALLCACEATLTETRRRVKGPVAEVGLIDAGAGRVRYALKGPGWLVAKRRKRAFGLMEKYCGGPQMYKVLGERDAEVSETPYTEDDLDAEKFMQRGHYRVESFREATFECVMP